MFCSVRSSRLCLEDIALSLVSTSRFMPMYEYACQTCCAGICEWDKSQARLNTGIRYSASNALHSTFDRSFTILLLLLKLGLIVMTKFFWWSKRSSSSIYQSWMREESPFIHFISILVDVLLPSCCHIHTLSPLKRPLIWMYSVAAFLPQQWNESALIVTLIPNQPLRYSGIRL